MKYFKSYRSYFFCLIIGSIDCGLHLAGLSCASICSVCSLNAMLNNRNAYITNVTKTHFFLFGKVRCKFALSNFNEIKDLNMIQNDSYAYKTMFQD